MHREGYKIRNIYLIIILFIMVMGLGCTKDGTEVQSGSSGQPAAGGSGGSRGGSGGTAGEGGEQEQTLTPQQFRTKLVEHDSFSLTNDLTLEGWESVLEYRGKLDGKGKKLTIKSFKAGAQGLISEIAQDGEVKDLTIELQAAFTIAMGEDVVPAGVLGAVNKGKVEGVKVVAKGDGKVKSANTQNASSTGGLIGKNEGSVTECSASVPVEGQQKVGGLVGRNDKTITNSYATGDVSATGENSKAGGLVGDNNGGTIKNSYATGDVSATGANSKAGGLVGDNNGGTIKNSYATGNVSGASDAGGLVGKNIGPKSKIENSYYASGNVQGTTRVGGLIGHNNGGTIENSYATGNVSVSEENSNAGGLVGDNDKGKIENSFCLKRSGLNSVGRGTSAVIEIATGDIIKDIFGAWSATIWRLENGKWPKLSWQP